ncbi:MAG: carboxypeptidase regulatory-like domain-containing protein, partial [Bacteroides sp.]|nr:carboxypeptidase regulatory-like domain-containing protein [Bacteroides sp.]
MFNKTILSLAIAALATLSANARTINIHGKVTIKGSGEPVPAVVIRNGETNKIIGGTDDDGNYLITADSEGTLFLESLTCDDMTVEIDDRMKIDIEMIRSKNVLQEIVAIGKGSKKTFVMEDAELEIDGNMMKIKRYPVHIPPKLFSSDKRLIIQPAIYNVTRQHLSYLNPVVVDGKHYAITQERMDDWDTSVDPLTPYRRIKQGGNNKESNTFYITDSLYLENPSDDVFALIMPMIEDYNKVVYRDSFEVARGIINPFRWLKFSLDPMDMN